MAGSRRLKSSVQAFRSLRSAKVLTGWFPSGPDSEQNGYCFDGMARRCALVLAEAIPTLFVRWGSHNARKNCGQPEADLIACAGYGVNAPPSLNTH